MPTYRPLYVGLQYSEALADAYVHTPADDPVLVTLELHHDLFSEPIRVVNDWEPLDATLEADAPLNPSAEVEFAGIPFTFVRTAETDSGAPAAVTIVVDNLSTIITQMIMGVQESEEPILVMIRSYLRTDTSAPHELPVLRMFVQTPVSIDSGSARLSCSFGDLTNRRFPGLLYRRFQRASPCFNERFSGGLSAYTAESGTAEAFSVATGVLATVQGGPDLSEMRRSFGARTVVRVSFKFKLTSLNSDDACILRLFSAGVQALAFWPRRELVLSAGIGSAHAAVGISASVVGMTPAALDVATNYQFELEIVPGAGNSTLDITRISDMTLIASNAMSGDLEGAMPDVDALGFLIDAGGSGFSETRYWDINICAATE